MTRNRRIHGVLLACVFAAAPLLSAAPQLVLSGATAGPFNVNTGTNGAAQTIEAFNAGDGALNLTATASAAWLSATVGAQRACTTRGGNCLPVNISFSTSALAAGTYTEFVTVSDPNAVDAPQDIAVSIRVMGIPSSLTFYTSPLGGGSPTASSLILPVGTVSGAVSTTNGGNWLSFISNGKFLGLPSNYGIQAVAPASGVGTYNGSVVLSGSSTPADNATIAVTLNVTAAPIIDLSTISTIRLFSYPGGPKQFAGVSFNSAGQTALSITGASGSAAFLTAAKSAANSILITADPGSSTAGTYTGAVTISSNAANNALVSIPVELVVYSAGTPVMSAGGTINIATYAPEAVAPGDIVAIFGDEFAAVGSTATNPGPPPLATKLGNTQVLVNGAPVPLYSVTEGQYPQINFQVPYTLTPGTATVQVTNNGVASNLRPITIASTAPRLLPLPAFVIAGGYGIIVNFSDGSFPLPSATGSPNHPAKPGDVLIIYGIGFGQTSPAATTGAAASGTNLENAPSTSVTFGSNFAPPVTAVAPFSGLTPTAVGLYQINITVPANAPVGAAIPVVATINGVASNVVYMAISANGK